MNIFRFASSLLLVVASAAFSGCSEPADGDWPSIRFSVNGEVCPKSEYRFTYKAPAEGGTFNIASSNYGRMFWPYEVYENGSRLWPEELGGGDYYNMHLTGAWYDVTYDIHGYLVVVVQPKAPGEPARSLTFKIECGDSFGEFTLMQE